MQTPSFVATLADLERTYTAQAFDVFDMVCAARGIAVPEPSIARRMLIRACRDEFPAAIADALASFPIADSVFTLLRISATFVAARVADEWQRMMN